MAKNYVSKSNFELFINNLKEKFSKDKKTAKAHEVIESILGKIKIAKHTLYKSNWTMIGGRASYILQLQGISFMNRVITVFDDNDSDVIAICQIDPETESFKDKIEFKANSIPTKDLEIFCLILREVE